MDTRCIRNMWIGFGRVRCPEPVDGRDGGIMCTEHAIECCRDQMALALADGDHECAAEYAESLRQLGVDAHTALQIAA